MPSGVETQVINKSSGKTLMTFKRRTRTSLGPVTKDNQWRIRMKIELEKLYKDVNIRNFI